MNLSQVESFHSVPNSVTYSIGANKLTDNQLLSSIFCDPSGITKLTLLHKELVQSIRKGLSKQLEGPFFIFLPFGNSRLPVNNHDNRAKDRS